MSWYVNKTFQLWLRIRKIFVASCLPKSECVIKNNLHILKIHQCYVSDSLIVFKYLFVYSFLLLETFHYASRARLSCAAKQGLQYNDNLASSRRARGKRGVVRLVFFSHSHIQILSRRLPRKLFIRDFRLIRRLRVFATKHFYSFFPFSQSILFVFLLPEQNILSLF